MFDHSLLRSFLPLVRRRPTDRFSAHSADRSSARSLFPLVGWLPVGLSNMLVGALVSDLPDGLPVSFLGGSLTGPLLPAACPTARSFPPLIGGLPETSPNGFPVSSLVSGVRDTLCAGLLDGLSDGFLVGSLPVGFPDGLCVNSLDVLVKLECK